MKMESKFKVLDILKAKTENVYVCNERTGEQVEMPAYKANGLKKNAYYVVISTNDEYITVIELDKKGQAMKKNPLMNTVNLYADREFDLVGQLKFELNV